MAQPAQRIGAILAALLVMDLLAPAAAAFHRREGDPPWAEVASTANLAKLMQAQFADTVLAPTGWTWLSWSDAEKASYVTGFMAAFNLLVVLMEEVGTPDQVERIALLRFSADPGTYRRDLDALFTDETLRELPVAVMMLIAQQYRCVDRCTGPWLDRIGGTADATHLAPAAAPAPD
ncbi:MAG TPA: hypothetical protein VF234_01785 [Limnochordia bacterium]